MAGEMALRTIDMSMAGGLAGRVDDPADNVEPTSRGEQVRLDVPITTTNALQLLLSRWLPVQGYASWFQRDPANPRDLQPVLEVVANDNLDHRCNADAGPGK